MNYFLHIETATDVCSVALSKDNELLVLNEEKDSRMHSEIITLQIQDVMNRAGVRFQDLSAVSLSEGPGSYTSLRVGMSAAKAICYTHSIPLISVNTLESLAVSIIDRPKTKYLFCSMIDARRMEVYASLFNSDMSSIYENTPIILDNNSFKAYFDKGYTIIFSGNGVDKFQKLIVNEKVIFTKIACSAKNLISTTVIKYRNNNFQDIAYFSPNYIKPPNITTPKVKRL